jgi:AcrR family transcriptional regulator
MDAGLELFGTQGIGETTITSLCAKAKLTERYFYESFGDLEGLLVAVFDRIAQETAEVVLAAVEAAPREARPRARAAIAAMVELMTDDPRKGRVAFVEALSSERLVRSRHAAIRTFAGILADQAREFYGPPAAAEQAVAVTSFMLVGGLAETLIAWLAGSVDVTRDELIGEATDLFVAAGEAAARTPRRPGP